jgi:hypothetical protein
MAGADRKSRFTEFSTSKSIFPRLATDKPALLCRPGMRVAHAATRGVHMRAEEGDESIEELADEAKKTQKKIDDAVEGDDKSIDSASRAQKDE